MSRIKETTSSFERHALKCHYPLYKWFLRDLEIAQNKGVGGLNILDIGCGPGFMLEVFKNSHANMVVGLDISPTALKAAEVSRRADNCLLTLGDSAFLPFKSDMFDVVFSRGSVFFWHDKKNALKSIFRVLKKGGSALIGGGFGLSTPQETVDYCKALRVKSDKSGHEIPRLKPEELLNLAAETGGTAKLLTAQQRGFWLFWQK